MIRDSVVSAARSSVALVYARLNPPAPVPEHRCGVLAPDVVAAIATAQRRLDGVELPPLRRQIRATLEYLAEAGVDVQDHAGAEFVAGQGLEVVAGRRCRASIGRPWCRRSGRACVCTTKLIQTGEVIVGIPTGGAL
ncbi:hypothetical protein [Nocardia sp. NPDC052112]|uniref:hypothetical protein n=1 Tax=Nocardia sp. NPDC052112 TaxID=3155646 RepID=UPI003427E95F